MTDCQNSRFSARFTALTGHPPFPWQQRLYERFVDGGEENNIPAAAAIPTGLGKTRVIAVWLLGLMKQAEKMPRRLVYVVNRRTVVDQTTAEVNKYRERIKQLPDDDPLRLLIERLGISTLRGQFADKEEWAADPSRPAVICGTVDMIGSRLLFEGYRIGRGKRPLHAGFLGQDALLVHDEAHLEPAFQKLIKTIQCEQGNCRKKDGKCVRCGRNDRPRDFHPVHVMALSATARGNAEETETDGPKPFGLTDEENQPPDVIPNTPTEPIHHVWRRLKAKKSLQLHEITDEKKLADEIATRALEHKDTDTAVLVFVRTIDDVNKVCDKLTNQNGGIPADRVRQLTGTIRGLERDQLVDHWILKCFLRQACPLQTVYLVCTSAGEVGVNLSADHMVCDLSTLDSMIQRLGRVNRFGEPKDHVAQVDVVVDAKLAKAGAGAKASALEKAIGATYTVFRRWAHRFNGQANPNPLNLRSAAAGQSRAFAPEPTILTATDILFDAWALTTIKGKMPGRPPVAPYLHGVADDLPQTTVVWRAEMDLVDVKSPEAENTLKAIFTKHRIRPHETLTVGMTKEKTKWKFRAIKFLEDVVKKRPDIRDVRIGIQSSGRFRLMTIGQLIDDPGPLNAEPTLVLPASFGGLDGKGTLSADAVPKKEPPQDESEGTDIDEDASKEDAETPTPTLDIADHDGYEPYDDVPARIRVLIFRSDDGWSVRPMPGGKLLPDEWELEDNYDTSTPLVNAIRKQSKLNVRLVQAIKKNDEGEDVRSLVCLSPAPQHQPQEEQSLADHVAAVEKEAKRIADALNLPEPYRSALLFAAKWHDEGKKAPVWQRYIGVPNGNNEPLGKSAKWRDGRLLAGYRHEFGSLLRIEHPSVLQTSCTLPEDEDVKDLALHIIAAHHGHARPHFKHTIDHDFTTQQSEQTHLEVMRRYARLQRKYGRWGLAYLESLLRAADRAASRAKGFDDQTDDDDPEEGER